MKKSLIALFTILICTGCGGNAVGKPDIELFESKIDYILFRDKKIYLSQNLEDYVMQFKGLDCKFKAEDSQIQSDMSIDNINDTDHAFYSLYVKAYDNYAHGGFADIRCNDSSNGGDSEFDVFLASVKTEESQVLYTDMKIEQWQIYSGFSDEEIKVFIDGKSLVIEGQNNSTKEDVIEIMGNDYTVEKSIFDEDRESYTYPINGVIYKFYFDDEDLLYYIDISD